MLASIDWSQLWRESRPEIIGGLVVLIVGALLAAFWKRIFPSQNHPENVDPPRTIQSPPQEVVVKIEPVQPAPPAPPPLQGPPLIVGRVSSTIPRPPQTGFVARRDESGHEIVERLKEELAPDRDQLIVLWGGGGVGKTTLAAETARTMRNVFAGGIIWTSADGKPDYSLSTLLDEIATHLDRPDLRQLASGPKDEEIHLALSRAPTPLIVLDNFETISPEEQKKCAEWLANRASGPALITSRDEVPYARPIHILAMSLPEAREFLKALISVARNPKVFGELDHDEIIQAADRIPLVLQWVVKQIDSAKVPSSVMDELSHGEGDAAERVFDRSFDLAQVGDDGRATLLALSLFVPSASRVALCEVAGFGNDIKRLERTAQQLAELWLIQTSDRNERLKVEGLTRELTKARLDKDERAENYRRRFVNYFRDYAGAHKDPIPQNYDTLETEKDNLLNSMETAFQLADWDNLYALAYTVAFPDGGMLSVRGYWAEALKANRQALEAARLSNSQPQVGDFAHNLAMMHTNRGELAQAQALCNESLEISRNLGDQSGISISLHLLGWLSHQQGEFSEAQRLYDESLEIERKLGSQRGIARSLHQLGWLAHQKDELPEARRLYTESVETLRKLGDQNGIANGLHHLGLLAQAQGYLAEARRLYDESLEIARRLGDQSSIAISLAQLGDLAETEGKPKEATRLFGEALLIFEKLNSPYADIVRSGLDRLKRDALEK